MKFLNLDLHISVIEDIKNIFTDLGHQVTSWNMSNANWVFDRKPSKVDVIGQHNWWNLNTDLCNKFYDRYCRDFDKYDAFIVTFPPAFSWLFEKFKQPIIIQAPIRYEVPFTGQPDLWRQFNSYLSNGIDSGKIIPCANSKLDQKYAEYFTKKTWNHIPNICAYTKATYNPRKPDSLWYSRLPCPSISGLVEKHQALGKHYPWTTLVKYKSMVCVPYNGSTMTLFECYTSNLPMFFPSLEEMRRLRLSNPQQVLCESTWAQTLNMPSKSSILDNDLEDPNNFNNIDVFMKWASYSDFYDTEWMPHLQYFDNYDDLKNKLGNIDFVGVSQKMQQANMQRRENIYNLWKNIIGRIK